MPTPATGVTNRTELGQTYVEIDLLAQLMGYIGLQALPWMPSEIQSGNFKKVKLEALLRKVDLDSLRRDAEGAYVRDSYEYTDDNFITEEYGKEEPVDDREAAILDRAGGIASEQLAADRSVAHSLNALEQAIAAKVFDTTIAAGQQTAAGVAWSTVATGKPITDVKAGKESFEERVGFGPNTFICNEKVARNILLTDQVTAQLGYRPSEGLAQEQLQGNLQASTLAQVLGVPRVLIAGGFKNTKLPGVSPTLSRIWADANAALLFVSEGMDLRRPTFGRVIGYTADGAGAPITIENYYEERIRSTVVRARFDLHVKVIHSELLQLFTGVT